MKKLFCIITFVLCMCLSSSKNFASGLTNNCQVSIPSFKVVLNGVEIDNINREYPLIIYKGITYFPLTYYDCRFLGLISVWDTQEGLQIKKENISCGYRDYLSQYRNENSYLATIPTFKIKINEKLVDNSKEKYPFLLFRNVTYFPMTWRFCVDEFNWNYSYDNGNGLVIDSVNKNVKTVMNSTNYYREDILRSAIYENVLYYIDSDGDVYKKDIFDTAEDKKIYQLPMIYEDYVSKTKIYAESKFEKIDDELYLIININNHRYYHKIDKNGDIVQTVQDKLFRKIGNDISVEINQAIPPGPDNIIINKADNGSFNRGNTEYYYGWGIREGAWIASNDLYIVDNYIYVLAIETEDSKLSKVVRINMDTNEITIVSDISTLEFEVVDNHIYFTDKDKYLHKIDIQSFEEKIIDTSKWMNFKVFENTIYYADKNERLFIYGNDKPINEKGKLFDMQIFNRYLLCQFKEDNSVNDRMLIFNKENQIIFRCSDIAEFVYISPDGIMTYIEKNTKNIYQVNLNNKI